MEVIDEGGFGCVIKPPLNCLKGPRSSTSMVSKLQPKKYAEFEMKQINKIKSICKSIPNCDNYTILSTTMCQPNIPKNLHNKSKCSLLEPGLNVLSYANSTKKSTKAKSKAKSKAKTLSKKNSDSLAILNMPYMGVNLHRHILLNVDFKNPDTFVSINNAIIDLYQNFIMPLNNKKFYHNDIKTLNILVGKDGHFRLIDWGIANNIILSSRFIFNKPYMYILMSNYFIEKLEEMKRSGHLSRDRVEQAIMNYIELSKMRTSQDYIYSKEILEFLFPTNVSTTDQETGINPVLFQTLVQTALRFKSAKEWTSTYIHNLDIAGVAIMYPDILCAMGIKKVYNFKLQQGIINLFTKYVLECYEPINEEEFIDDLNKLNLLVV